MEKKKVMTNFGLLVSAITCAGLGKYLNNKYKIFPLKNSVKWIKQLSDEDWEIEREKVRTNFCNPNYSYKKRLEFQHLLQTFDNVKHSTDSSNQDSNISPVHREHGWYLPNDD